MSMAGSPSPASGNRWNLSAFRAGYLGSGVRARRIGASSISAGEQAAGVAEALEGRECIGIRDG
jgi:hypothetical protein